MEIVGQGFLARNLSAAFGDRHPGVTVLAAGVSSTHVTDEAELAREIDLARRVARDCARAGRVVVAFSTASHAMYGTTTVPAREDDPVAPTSAYGRNKLLLEDVVARSGAPWLALRLSHVVGPGQRPHQLVPGFVQQVRAGRLRLRRNTYRDLVDVADVVAVLDGLLREGVRGEVVNVASGHPVAVEELATAVELRLGLTARREYVDAEPVRTLVSLDKLHSLLPAPPPLGGEGYLGSMLDRYVGPAHTLTTP